MIKDAVISDCGQYRYKLSRDWDHMLPRCIFIGLNPSTADAEIDDPTIRRLIGFTKAWGCSGFNIINIFALRSKDPKTLRYHPDPVGRENHRFITAAYDQKLLTVAMWGKGGEYRRILSWSIGQMFPDLMCFGKNLDGSPKHPLYLPKGTGLVRYLP